MFTKACVFNQDARPLLLVTALGRLLFSAEGAVPWRTELSRTESNWIPIYDSSFDLKPRTLCSILHHNCGQHVDQYCIKSWAEKMKIMAGLPCCRRHFISLMVASVPIFSGAPLFLNTLMMRKAFTEILMGPQFSCLSNSRFCESQCVHTHVYTRVHHFSWRKDWIQKCHQEGS